MKYTLLLLFTLNVIANKNPKDKFFFDPINAGFPKGIEKVNTTKDMFYLIVHKGKDEERFNSIKDIYRYVASPKNSPVDLGHVQLAWSCKLKDKKVESGIGFTADIEQELRSLIQQKKYLNALNLKTTNFRMESPLEISKKLKDRINSIVIIPIPAKDKCQQVLTNLWNFINKKNKSYSLFKTQKAKNTFNCTSSILNILKPLALAASKKKLYSKFIYKNQEYKFISPSKLISK